MIKKRHKPPSRIRYEKNNPTLSLRINKAWIDELKKFLADNNMSIGDFFRIAFKKQKANYQNASYKGYKIGILEGIQTGRAEGYESAKKEWAIRSSCSICNKEIYIPPNSDVHKAIIGYMKDHHWVHVECNEKNKQKQNRTV